MGGLIAFEGDTYIRTQLEGLRDRFNLVHCIETGTQHGSTTAVFAEMFNHVVTIEADEEYYEGAKERLGRFVNVHTIHALSQDALGLPECRRNNALYYLDAHGCDIGGCPLKEELKIIANQGVTNVVIAVHDFRVPGKDFGYDAYDYPLEYKEIEPYLLAIYPNGYDYHYNEQANGAYRGIIYIYPDEISGKNSPK